MTVLVFVEYIAILSRVLYLDTGFFVSGVLVT